MRWSRQARARCAPRVAISWKKSPLWRRKQESAKLRKQIVRARAPSGRETREGRALVRHPSLLRPPQRGPHHSRPEGAERLSGRAGGTRSGLAHGGSSRHPHLRPGQAGNLWKECRPESGAGSYAVVRRVLGVADRTGSQMFARNQATVCLSPSSSSITSDHPSTSAAFAGSMTIRSSSPGRASA
jgi:hypothetical protein